MAIAACLYLRDAEHDIQEWIAYHAILGVDAFLIYDNGSLDRTVHNALALKSVCDVRIISWGHDTGPISQGNAYNDCLKRFRDEFHWILFLDSDEFLVSARGQAISDLLRGRIFDGLVAFNWACFGSSGLIDTPDDLTIGAFNMRSDPSFGANKHTKVAVQPLQAKAFVNPHYFDVSGRVVRPNGRVVDWESPGITQTVDFSDWYVAHFFVRSRQQWREKLARGYRDVVRDPELFAIYDRNEVLDGNLQALKPRVLKLLTSASQNKRRWTHIWTSRA